METARISASVVKFFQSNASNTVNACINKMSLAIFPVICNNVLAHSVNVQNHLIHPQILPSPCSHCTIHFFSQQCHCCKTCKKWKAFTFQQALPSCPSNLSNYMVSSHLGNYG